MGPMDKLLNPCLSLPSGKLGWWVIVRIKKINKFKGFRTMPCSSKHSLWAVILFTGETVETVPDFIFLGSKVTAAMKLKDAYSLEEKLWPT